MSEVFTLREHLAFATTVSHTRRYGGSLSQVFASARPSGYSAPRQADSRNGSSKIFLVFRHGAGAGQDQRTHAPSDAPRHWRFCRGKFPLSFCETTRRGVRSHLPIRITNHRDRCPRRAALRDPYMGNATMTPVPCSYRDEDLLPVALGQPASDELQVHLGACTTCQDRVQHLKRESTDHCGGIRPERAACTHLRS
jgi:hypothetical protein